MDQPIELSDRMLASLKATRPWAMFIAIVWFIGIASMILLGLAMLTGLYAPFARPGMPAAVGRVAGIIYVVLALVYLTPAQFLYRYSRAIAGLRAAATAEAFETALRQQKSFWKFMGILLIAVLVIYVLFVIGVIVVGVHMAALHH